MLLAHLTDTHVAVPGARTAAIGETAGHLAASIAFVNALDPQPAAVCITGDLVNRGRAEEYGRFRELVAVLRAPVYVVPGNHDRRDVARANLPQAWFPAASPDRIRYTVDLPEARIIALDTTEPGRMGGALDAASLAWLEATLAETSRPVAIAMHHPPFRTGVRLADLLGFRGLAAFRAIVARHGCVRLVIAGHVHCAREGMLGTVRLMTAPSTAPQRVPELFERHPIGLRREFAAVALHRWTGTAFATMIYRRAGGGAFTAS